MVRDLNETVNNQSPKNVGNLGTGFLRKVSKSEEGSTRISHINIAKLEMVIMRG